MRRKGTGNTMIRRAVMMIHPTMVGALSLVSAALLATGHAAPVNAATFTVNSTADAVDAAPGNGTCATAADECTLRAAIQEANAGTGADTINIPAGSYSLLIQGANEDSAATGDLDITGTLTIIGTGVGIAVVTGIGDRVFDVQPGATVTLSRLTIQSGLLTAADAAGGGIRNAGNLTLLNVAVRNNTVQNGDGGGIANLSGSRLELTNVTLNGNVALSRGGGIANDVGGAMQLVNVTLTDNGAFQGGNIDNLGDAELVNTIVANSRAGLNCTGGAIQSLGYNIDDGGSCFLSAPGDLSNTDPALGALVGSFVFALSPGSPAIDAGDNGHCPPTDQRGQPRPADGNMDGIYTCDIGAYEFPGPVQFTPTPSPTPSPTPEIPTVTPTSTPVPGTSTPTPLLPTITPGGAAIVLSNATGSPGDQVTFSATLETGGAIVGGAQNDITFDSSNILVAALPSGGPDCVKNPDLADKGQLFLFRPTGCTGAMCTMLRSAVFSSAPPISPIADGSILYTCTLNISPAAVPGEYALAVSTVVLSDPLGNRVAAVGVDGKVEVVPQPTATMTASATSIPSATATTSPTETASLTPSQTFTPSVAGTATPTPLPCVGDCNHSNEVTINEIITMVNIALGNSPVSDCPAGDANGDGEITVNEIIAAVNNTLTACPMTSAS